jgi:hypothetical protein
VKDSCGRRSDPLGSINFGGNFLSGWRTIRFSRTLVRELVSVDKRKIEIAISNRVPLLLLLFEKKKIRQQSFVVFTVQTVQNCKFGPTPKDSRDRTEEASRWIQNRSYDKNAKGKTGV